MRTTFLLRWYENLDCMKLLISMKLKVLLDPDATSSDILGQKGEKAMKTGNENVKLYAIGAFAKLTGVTERALRYYDRQGLLKPSSRNAQGHRYYTEQDLYQLQKILTLKYLNFSLEDIAVYLNKPEHDLLESLAVQYELLKQKQRQLERVLGTIERMRSIAEGAGQIDSDMLLAFIHNLHHEDVQMEWLARQMPEAIVDAIFLKDIPPEQRLELERELTACLIQLKQFFKQGKQPQDPEVLDSGRKLLEVLQPVITTILRGFDEQELAKFEALDENGLDPMLFPNSFTKEEEEFLAKVMEQLDALKHISGGEKNGN